MNPASDALSKGSVLIVDDNLMNIKVAQTILSGHGFQTHSIDNSRAVVDWVQTHQPDLVLLDIMMPEIDGLEVCRQLKGNPATSRIPVIFLTAKTGPENLTEGFHVGGVDYVTKPVFCDELVARVRAHVENYQLQKILSSALEDVRIKNNHLQDSINHISKLKGALLQICAWTKKVKVNDEWINIEKYLSQYLGLELTHGISEEALAQMIGPETPPTNSHQETLKPL